MKMTKTIIVAAAALCIGCSAAAAASQNWGKSSDDNPYAYGPGISTCGKALDIFKGDTGNLAIISYIGGYVTAINTITAAETKSDGDLTNGEDIQTLATSVGTTCKAHRDWSFQKAIMTVLRQLKS
jgi:hypothetical protein